MCVCASPCVCHRHTNTAVSHRGSIGDNACTCMFRSKAAESPLRRRRLDSRPYLRTLAFFPVPHPCKCKGQPVLKLLLLPRHIQRMNQSFMDKRYDTSCLAKLRRLWAFSGGKERSYSHMSAFASQRSLAGRCLLKTRDGLGNGKSACLITFRYMKSRFCIL